jgi:hypothetical protein
LKEAPLRPDTEKANTTWKKARCYFPTVCVKRIDASGSLMAEIALQAESGVRVHLAVRLARAISAGPTGHDPDWADRLVEVSR